MRWLTSLICLILTVSTPSWVNAQAFRLQPQNATASGQGNAFAAQADDASAIHYNPAGMTQLSGIQMLFNTNLVGGSVKFTSPAGVNTRGDFGGSIAWPFPTQSYFTANLRDLGFRHVGNTVIGLGLTTPYALQTRYPLDGPFQTAVTSSALPLLDIKPTVAHQINDQLSVGVGADIYTFASFIGEGHLEQKFNWPGGGGIPAGTPVEVNGNRTAAGFNLSLLYTPFRNQDGKPLVNVGLQYRSQVTTELKGQFLVNGAVVADTRIPATLPQTFTLAIALWPVRDLDHEWKLEFDVDYVGWKSFRTLDAHLSTGGSLLQPQNWRNSSVFMLGTEYKWLRLDSLPNWEVAMRGGYIYTEGPGPDSTFTPAAPTFNIHAITLGTGFLCRAGGHFLGLIPCGGTKDQWYVPKAIGTSVAYLSWIHEARSVIGNRNPTVDGTYRLWSHIGTFNLNLLF
ncbi:MAG: outer membrane protein transport protein [Nitrospirota bacterium]